MLSHHLCDLIGPFSSFTTELLQLGKPSEAQFVTEGEIRGGIRKPPEAQIRNADGTTKPLGDLLKNIVAWASPSEILV